MSLNLNKISRPNTARRNSFFDEQLPSSTIAFRQAQSILVNQEPISGTISTTQILLPAE
jgi:hypothetical protein